MTLGLILDVVHLLSFSTVDDLLLWTLISIGGLYLSLTYSLTHLLR